MCKIPFPTVWVEMSIFHVTCIIQAVRQCRNDILVQPSLNYTICCILNALENKLSTDPPNKVEIEKDGTRTELKFNKETVF